VRQLLALSTHKKDLVLLEEGGLDSLLREFSLEGLELLPWGEIPEEFRGRVVGVHLPFQPVWLPFWLEEHSYLREVFPGEDNLVRFFGGTRKEDFISLMAKWFRQALCLKPRYLVLHASHCGVEEVFSLRFRYDTNTVLFALAELLNLVFEETWPLGGKDLPVVLFENLWWPGLRSFQSEEIEFLFSRLRLPVSSLGLVLDTSHLLNLSYLLKRPSCSVEGPVRPAQALSLLWQAIRKIPAEIKELIRVVHLNFSPRCDLFVPDQRALEILLETKDPLERFSLARKRVLAMDPHLPFVGVDLRFLLEDLAPDFLVHELRFTDCQELFHRLTLQRSCLS